MSDPIGSGDDGIFERVTNLIPLQFQPRADELMRELEQPEPSREQFEAFGDSEDSFEEWRDHKRLHRGMARWELAELEPNTRASWARLAYMDPQEFWPPPEGVTLEEVAAWMGYPGDVEFVRRVLDIPPDSDRPRRVLRQFDS